MPETDRALLPSMRSERVARLLAACIRVAAFRNYAYSLTPADALDLARVYDLKSALAKLEQTMEVHRGIPDRDARMKLSVAEAKLDSSLDPESERIIEVRKASLDALGNTRSATSDQRALLGVLYSIQVEMKRWSTIYRRFLDEIYDLREVFSTQIMGLKIPIETRLQACSELDDLLHDAILKAGNDGS